MVVIYYIKLFRTDAESHNGILMSLLLLVAETIKDPELVSKPHFFVEFCDQKFSLVI